MLRISPSGGGKIGSLLTENLLTGTKDFSGDWITSAWNKTSEKYNGLTVYSARGAAQRYKAEKGE